MSDLAKRLRAKTFMSLVEPKEAPGRKVRSFTPDTDCVEAADRIDKLREACDKAMVNPKNELDSPRCFLRVTEIRAIMGFDTTNDNGGNRE